MLVFGAFVAKIEINSTFEPATVKAFMKNELKMKIDFVSSDSEQELWCESDVIAEPPLSLAYDKPLKMGKMRVGILKPGSNITKTINVYTLPNNYPDTYGIKITAYLYGDDGTIVERIEKSESIDCIDIKQESKESGNRMNDFEQ